jgi:hypothetical protein
MHAGEGVYLKRTGPRSHSCASRKRLGKVREKLRQGLVPSDTELSIPLKTMGLLVDVGKIIPYAPEVGVAELAQLAKQLPIRGAGGGFQGYAWLFFDADRTHQKVSAHNHRQSIDL